MVELLEPLSLSSSVVFSDNSSSCSGNLADSTSLIAFNIMPAAYFCKVQKGQQLPAYVRLSANKTCEPSSLSTLVPVWNRDELATPPEGVGMCVHGCAYTLDGNSEKAYEDIVQFPAMVKVLGAKVVTL